MKQSQYYKILEALKRGEEISPLDALNKFGCFRLGARIWEMRTAGHKIIDVGTENFARYKLIPEVKETLPEEHPTLQKPALENLSLFT